MWEMDNQIYGYMQKRDTDLDCNFAILRYDTVAIKVTLDGFGHCPSLTTNDGCELAITALIRGSVPGPVQDSQYLYSDHNARHMRPYTLNVTGRYDHYMPVSSHEAMVSVLASLLVPCASLKDLLSVYTRRH